MKSWAYASALTLLLASISAHAAGDVAAGKVKADTCMGCHGIVGYTNAYPTYRVPRLGGQHAAYLESALKAYRSGDRKHVTMHAQAASMSDQDIADLAAWLSQAANGEEK
ncbi:MAG: c-type cytochrome [Oceanococcus sp.]